MSLEDIKSQVAEMPQNQLDHLAAYLVHLRHQRDRTAHQDITARIDDKNPTHWVSPAELREKWED